MIYDRINRIGEYFFNDTVLRAIHFCKTAVDKEPGRYEIINDTFAMVQQYDTASEDSLIAERHESYIDIQYIVSGEEKIGVCNIDDCNELGTIDEELDMAIVTDGKFQYVTLKEGEFVILFPHEVHKPKIMTERSQNVKKVIIKMPIMEF